MTYNWVWMLLFVVLVLPVMVTMLVFLLSFFTGWDVKFGIKIPVPLLDIIRLHEMHDVKRPVCGVYIGYHFIFLQVIWGEL